MSESVRSGSKILVSAIIPTYNREGTITRAVDSALSQTWKSLEVIVVDDGSTDRTEAVLSRYGDRIRVIRQKNCGPGAARNTGIRASNGQIIAFLDSDDVWLPEKTERQIDLLQRTYDTGVRCCVCNAQMVSINGQTTTSFGIADLKPPCKEGLWLNPTEILLTRFLFFNQVVAVWRKTLEQTGYYRTDLNIFEDYELALRLSLKRPWAFISRELVIWKGGAENSLSSSASELDTCNRAHEILTELGRSSVMSQLLPKNLLRQRVRYLQGCICAHKLSVHPNRFASMCGRIMLLALRGYKAVGGRLPWYPRMISRGV